jgi:hypothetical protein
MKYEIIRKEIFLSFSFLLAQQAAIAIRYETNKVDNTDKSTLRFPFAKSKSLNHPSYPKDALLIGIY